MRRPARRAAALAGLALGLAWLAAPAGAQDAEGESTPVARGEAIAEDRAVVADGHLDIGPRFVEGEWTLMVRDDTIEPSVWRHLPDIVLHASDAATVEVPDDPEFGFLGTTGTRVWLLPQVQQPGILWPGWNTQDPEVATTVVRDVTWRLTATDGPGDFVLFVNGEFGRPTTVFDSRQPYPQATGIDSNTHAHGNWVFTAPGIYLLEIEMAATIDDGTEVAATGALQVAVGDTTDPQTGFAATTTTRPPTTADADPPGEPARSPDDSEASSPAWVPVVLGAAALAVGAALVVRAMARRRRGSEPATEGDGP